MARWPELLEKQIHNYYEEGVEWKQIARTRLVPHLTERLPRMRSLHRRFLKELPDSWARVCRVLQPDFSARFVIYVGICVGAGWAARYGGQPACLFGLENPAELVSAKNEGSPGAVSHEVAHLAHYEWRRKEGLRGIEEPRGPF